MVNHFTRFKTDISEFELPEKFTFPFYYQPTPLAIAAVKELQEYLSNQSGWNEAFGLTNQTNAESAIGKMFGVMVVKNEDNEIGYISAFSGKLFDSNDHQNFVPPVFDMLTENSFFKVGIEKVNEYSKKISELEKNNTYIELLETLKTTSADRDKDINKTKEKNRLAKKKRDQIRSEARITIFEDEFTQLCTKLKQESANNRFFLKHLIKSWDEKIEALHQKIDPTKHKIQSLKNARHQKSIDIQNELFESYNFLNAHGETKNLLDIFKDTALKQPPAAAGECAAPKLLHYAFSNKLTPITIAEFWWGKSPKSEIRKHLHYYPACQGKCKPILGHMLQGLDVDENPMLKTPEEKVQIETVYEDDHMLVINKPVDLLSVPGVNIKDCVHNRIKEKYPKAKGPIIVHRLDMQTSGLMLIAKNKNAHKQLQKQFIERTIKKQYLALLDGIVIADKGEIDLPLRPDFEDRPRQLVCYDHGKPSITQWEVLERKDNKTLIRFFPITGRTHQLRVHSAHHLGLNIPIVGDDLYGKFGNRLHLHAEYIQFKHPVTHVLMEISVPPTF